MLLVWGLDSVAPSRSSRFPQVAGLERKYVLVQKSEAPTTFTVFVAEGGAVPPSVALDAFQAALANPDHEWPPEVAESARGNL